MSLFNTLISESNQPGPIFDEDKLKRSVNEYINRMKVSAWSYHYNRIFIYPRNSFNVKYLVKFLSKNLAKRNRASKLKVQSNNSENQLISQKKQHSIVNEVNAIKDIAFVKDKEEVIIDDILDMLTAKEFFRLLNVEPEKRLETVMNYYHIFNKILDALPFEKLDKLCDTEISTEIPYEIYIEAAKDADTQCEYSDVVSTVDGSDLLGLLKSCGVIVIDISGDITALSRGKEIFRSFKRAVVTMKDKDRALALKNKRLIVVLSTVMTWAGTGKRRILSEDYAENRVPHPEFMDHYEFELEALAVNKTEGLNEILSTIVVWSGITYGFEQDLLRFAFDSACKSSDSFPIPNFQNHVPVIHVENLARLVHKIITESHVLKNRGIFATERAVNTLKQIITALGKACDARMSIPVSLTEFITKYKLEGLHKEFISADVKVNSSINQLLPGFVWYNGKSSIVSKMKYLVETFKREHHLKSIKLLILGPPASGKTKLAHQLAKHYGLIYLNPQKITESHIDGIRSELVTMRNNIRDFGDDDFDKVKVNDTISNKKISELDQYLNNLYSSIDSNAGVLEDVHLIPLLNDQISLSISYNHGYVLDGYPVTTDQAKQIFGDINSLQKIDFNKLPDLTVYLKPETHSFSNKLLPQVPSEDIDIATNTLETKHLKNVKFEKSNTLVSFDPSLTTTPKQLSHKPALKKFTKPKNRKNPKSLMWNEQNNNDLLKMISGYYVAIKTIDFPYPQLYSNAISVESMETDLTYLNIVIEEIKMSHAQGLLKKINETNSIPEETNDKLKNNTALQLKKKMTLQEEFETISDFEHIERLSSEEYLMKYVTPTLTKLVVQVAKVRPRNPVNFLAHIALKENSEGLPELPGYSKECLKVKNILERMYRITNVYNVNNINSSILMEMLSAHSTDDR